MKTILYNPIFINPQAYYVFPRLTRWLRPDNGYKEPANYIGQIEVTIIAYGEIGYTEYFEHTNYIDFTNFSNSYVRISLFTRLGSCVLGEWKIGAMESDRPYIEPEVLASLKAVVIVGDKTNQDKDRDTVANLVDASNPFVISNASYNLNSGYGLYAYDFTKWGLTKPPTTCIRETDKFTLTYVGTKVGKGVCIIETTNTSTSTIHVSFKVKISGIQDDTEGYFSNANNQHILLTNGINSIEMDVLTGHWYGFNFVKKDGSILGNCNIVVEQIPEFQGAFITDGVNDLIMSTKTVKQMGITDQITVVSMIHQIALNTKYNLATTNYIENLDNGKHIRSDVYSAGKTGIYGYSSSLINNNTNDIKNILGDRIDYATKTDNASQVLSNGKFSVVGRARNHYEASSIAWYWTIIANKVLTTDQINQVIAYFNLDRTLKPDILCNTIKQGITNENHAEFGDKLIDYSGNGRDIQLNNIAWDGDSGIGKYNYPNWKVTATIANTYSTIVNYPTVNGTYSINVNGVSELMQSIGLHLEIKYTTSTGIIYNDIKQDGVYSYILPDGATDLTLRFGGIPGIVNEPCNITVTQIPSHAGALCLDGVNDFGKVTGMPIYKDYTVVADYIRTSAKENAQDSPILSKSQVVNNGAFVFNYLNTNSVLNSYSFGINNRLESISDSERKIYYQSKYINDGKSINSGTGTDYNSMWLGTYRDNVQIFFNGAIYSLMSFPYSMSEFLIERQLKKYKLGTLYPDMVEFRPIIKHDDRITAIRYYHIKGSSQINLKPGDYIPVGSKISITTNLKSPYTIANVVSSSLTDIKVVPSAGGGNAYDILGYVTDKSPQKITMDIQTK